MPPDSGLINPSFRVRPCNMGVVMSHHVRPRGRRWELPVKHKMLPRAFYAMFATQAEGENYGQQLDAMLDRGIVPSELQAGEPKAADDPLLVVVVRADINGAAHLTASDDKLLGSMLVDLVDRVDLDHRLLPAEKLRFARRWPA